jgi:hypothetical protein
LCINTAANYIERNIKSKEEEFPFIFIHTFPLNCAGTPFLTNLFIVPPSGKLCWLKIEFHRIDRLVKITMYLDMKVS